METPNTTKKIQLITSNDDWVILRNSYTGEIYYEDHSIPQGVNFAYLLTQLTGVEVEVKEVLSETMEELCHAGEEEVTRILKENK